MFFVNSTNFFIDVLVLKCYSLSTGGEKMTVNERVREIRKSVKLTMEKFGERLGVGKVAISCIESGKNNVTEQMIKSICREFGYREEWLRDGIEPKQPPKLEEDELVNT